MELSRSDEREHGQDAHATPAGGMLNVVLAGG